MESCRDGVARRGRARDGAAGEEGPWAMFGSSRSSRACLRITTARPTSCAPRCASAGTFLLNLMSSPGSGKTTTLMRTIEALKDELNIAVMEADIDSDVDARTILDTGVRAIQLHTGGMCHLDAYMTEQGLDELVRGCRGGRPRRCCGWRCRRGGCRVPRWFHGRRGRGELRCAR